ncbi:Mitochondrial 37S ribosomal protein S26 [Lachnellula suecica]|uniref:Mitochondrial 37S ribosomal protein S26 n=1 Tax=Lachnellula suecica TaxID=602035 RepID=A0A8T9CFS9_9HELO|nr:Mitochondrial 37S ribosomal protein S26 [Lachnellula suecica]
MLRPALPRIGKSFQIFRRSLHKLPILQHEYRDGVPGLLSAAAFDLAWTQYQSLMIEKLNALTAGTEMSGKTPKDILIKYARDPNSAPHFNYASMAHNNDFFFRGLSPTPPPIEAHKALKAELEQSFSSMETLRLEFVNTAVAMFGPGFVWLVKDKSGGRYRILTTYLAGSPWPAAHYRRQTVDMNTERDGATSEHMRRIMNAPAANANRLGTHGQPSVTAPGGADIVPVLCLNTWEHVYLPDYGVGRLGQGGGKQEFAERWWDTIDWRIVDLNAKPVDKGNHYES